jgi:hypothetical protein
MNKAAWHQILKVLSQKSTITGIVALIGTIYALWGSELEPDQIASITGALAALLSVVAIILQPRPSGGHYKNTDYKIGDSYSDPDGTTRVFNGEVWE